MAASVLRSRAQIAVKFSVKQKVCLNLQVGLTGKLRISEISSATARSRDCRRWTSMTEGMQ